MSFDPVGGEVLEKPDHVAIYPATHFVTNSPAVERALVEIRRELDERCAWFEANGKMLEAHRLRQRTLLRHGDASRDGLLQRHRELLAHLARQRARSDAQLPAGLLPGRLPLLPRRVPHVAPAGPGDVRGRSLPQAEPRRLRFPPAERPRQPAAAHRRVPRQGPQIVFVSATPGKFELANSVNIAEQIIRPTGLVDPQIEVRPDGRPDRRSHERDPHEGGQAAARPGDDPDQDACRRTSPTTCSRTASR